MSQGGDFNNPVSIIHVKRNNDRPHSTQELEWWISEYAKGNIPDYQMSAWLMAVCFNGMDMTETATMTRCMVESGERLTWDNNRLPYLVDKHSTGGVGDKISIVLAPLVASLGVSVPMMAGRGLGHTGGTIDKLESIPGYQTSLSISDFQRIVQNVGCSIVAASSSLCPADRKLYGLRDVTATVSCIPLQTSSIMCKKIAENPNSLLLDCKYGKASFQASVEDAKVLAKSMIQTGEANGVSPTTAFLTRMDSFIGYGVGNWLEIKECIQLLKTGQASLDLKSIVIAQAAQMLQQSGKYNNLSWKELIQLVSKTLSDGAAFAVFQKMVQAHGGDVSILLCDNSDQEELYYPQSAASYSKTVTSTQNGYIADINGQTVGNLCVMLGAGRSVANEPVDAVAGMWFEKKVGDAVQIGDVIATIYTNRSIEILNHVCDKLQATIIYSLQVVTVPPIISHVVTSLGITEFDSSIIF